jgi:hypothetical protein
MPGFERRITSHETLRTMACMEDLAAVGVNRFSFVRIPLGVSLENPKGSAQRVVAAATLLRW